MANWCVRLVYAKMDPGSVFIQSLFDFKTMKTSTKSTNGLNLTSEKETLKKTTVKKVIRP